LQDGDQRRVRAGGLDRVVDRLDGLRLALGFQDERLTKTLCSQDRSLALSFRLLDGCLPVAIRDVHGRLLEAL